MFDPSCPLPDQQEVGTVPFVGRRATGGHTIPAMIREATLAEVAAIACVQVESWEAAYRGLMPDPIIDSFTVESRTDQWASFLSSQRRDRIVLLADHDADVVGMASLGTTRDRDLGLDAIGEVYAIYVVPGHWDHGHGRDLMDAAIGWFRSHDFREAILWVLESNTRADAFYQAGGWHPDGATRLDVLPEGTLSEVRFRRRFFDPLT